MLRILSHETPCRHIFGSREGVPRGETTCHYSPPAARRPHREREGLVGHEWLTPKMCYLGRRTYSPKNTSIIDKNGQQVRFETQLVEEVMRLEYVDFQRGDDIANFSTVTEIIHSTTGTDARKFVETILRIYCAPLHMVDPEVPTAWQSTRSSILASPNGSNGC